MNKITHVRQHTENLAELVDDVRSTSVALINDSDNDDKKRDAHATINDMRETLDNLAADLDLE